MKRFIYIAFELAKDFLLPGNERSGRSHWNFASGLLKKECGQLTRLLLMIAFPTNASASFARRSRLLRGVLILLLAAGALVFTGSGIAATVQVEVAPGGLIFSPASVSINVGDTVMWTWKASGHSVTSGVPGSPSGLFDSGIHSSGFTFSHTFTDPGTFGYYCTPHGA
ncbi:MAG: hypothetical protein H0T83_02880, partial [Chthoniobacterales bacterium]|nr:hypothetical protein [Chthoniobacterales bacterium]